MWQWFDKLDYNTNNDIMYIHDIHNQPHTNDKKHFYILDNGGRTSVSSFGDAVAAMNICRR